jgi:hypothetical protein
LADPDEVDVEEDVLATDVAEAPNDLADPRSIVQAKLPRDIMDRYEVFSYRNAAVILSETRREEFSEIIEVLRSFRMTTEMIRRAGGNESEIPKAFSAALRPRSWFETEIQGDLNVRVSWKEASHSGRKRQTGSRIEVRRNFLDGHKIDYVKGRVALDLEWNSKDQTFDRDLYAFAAFAQCGLIDAGVLITRGESLNKVIKSLGPALRKDGSVETTPAGVSRPTSGKFGASTTWMGKLLYRLNAGRGGGCPVLAVGISDKCIEDWSGSRET